MSSFQSLLLLLYYNEFLFCSEILRVIDSLQLTQKYKVATPADWTVN